MTHETRAAGRRAIGDPVYRFLAAVLMACIAVAGVQLIATLQRLSAEQSVAATVLNTAPGTATAIAALEPASEATRFPGQKRQHSAPSQDFPTNTPEAPAVQEATPAPVAPEGTPRPLPTLYIYDTSGDVVNAPTAVPAPAEALDRHGNDLVNIVLLGNDNEITGEEVARTDTMIVVSINRTTGTVAMLNIPRDLYVYIPGWTMQRINLAYPHGEAIGWTDGGFGLLRQTLFYNFGLNVHYFAMVDLDGFKTLVDAVGGVDIAVDCAIQDLPLVASAIPDGAYAVPDTGEWVLPVGMYHMNGAQALWYARSRNSSSDFDRGARQQQILRAVWHAARDQGLLSQVPSLYAEAAPLVQTNLTFEDILGLVPLAANLDPALIESFTVNRLYHTTPWQTPDGDYVQLPVPETMRELLQDFYSPPTENQIAAEAATIAVYNGTANANWDQVAAQRLQQDGFNAVALGAAADTALAATTMTDFTGRTKGSSLEQIARTLNINPANIELEPSATRDYDFVVTLGADYNSCTRGGVLPVATPAPGG